MLRLSTLDTTLPSQHIPNTRPALTYIGGLYKVIKYQGYLVLVTQLVLKTGYLEGLLLEYVVNGA